MNIKQELAKEMLSMLKSARKTAKEELPKVGQDLITEGIIHAWFGIGFGVASVVNLTTALLIYWNAEPAQYRDDITGAGVYLFVAVIIGLVGLAAGMSGGQQLLILKRAPRAYLLNQLNEMMNPSGPKK